jgi:four helix bundle protein
MDEDELKRRTKLFGLRIIKLVAALPNTIHAKIIGGQLVRAGTSVGANYRAACRARSKAEFISRLGVVEEEADESEFWLTMIVESGLMKARLVQPLITEAHELVAIMTASRISVARNERAVREATKRKRKSQIKNQKSKMPCRN